MTEIIRYPIITRDDFPFFYFDPIKYDDEINNNNLFDDTSIIKPKISDYKYNKNGIEVDLRGEFNNIMAILNSLEKCPPSLENQYNLLSKNTINAEIRGDNMIVTIDKKRFSGSGSIILVYKNTDTLDNAKFILFRNTKTNAYEDLGGKLDNSKIIDSILFENANKETIEESQFLFLLNKESDIYIDIESTLNKTFYRVYVYAFQINDLNDLKRFYDNNKVNILENGDKFDESYRETDEIKLFGCNVFKENLSKYKNIYDNISYGNFKTNDDDFEKVSSRCINVINELYKKNIFSIIKPSVVNITHLSNSHKIELS